MCLQLSSDSYIHSNRYSIHFVFTLFLSFRNIIFNKSFSYDLVACPSKCKNRNDLDRQVKVRVKIPVDMLPCLVIHARLYILI